MRLVRVVKPSAVETVDGSRVPDWERFPKAPITEALLDIQTSPPGGTSLEILANLQKPIREGYPNRRERRSWEGMVQMGPGGAVEMRQKAGGVDGYIFVSADGRQLVQARLDGFTFNRLRPYVAWEDFRNEAHDHWERYRDLVRPEGVSRIALRYINRIEIPTAATDFNEYVLTTPEIAPGLPQGLAGFLMRLIIPMERFESTVIITETIEPIREDVMPFILDIDAFVEKPFRPDSSEMWDMFETLRTCKNTVFFGSVTDRAKELFR